MAMNRNKLREDPSSIEILIENRTSFSLQRKELRKAIFYFVKKEQKPSDELSIVLLHDSHISELHEKYYGKEGPTDVLSFQYDEKTAEIILNPDAIMRDSESTNQSFPTYFLEVTIHGLLHLVGYDHTAEKDSGEHLKRQAELVDGVKNDLGVTVVSASSYEETRDKE